ncbi:hypothetical protein C8Q76DRAFT_754808 [Earliella scabrosa]|nr:hypothetical protein C8Q76DRAFT_754808 [Earliella scabrosa]
MAVSPFFLSLSLALAHLLDASELLGLGCRASSRLDAKSARLYMLLLWTCSTYLLIVPPTRRTPVSWTVLPTTTLTTTTTNVVSISTAHHTICTSYIVHSTYIPTQQFSLSSRVASITLSSYSEHLLVATYPDRRSAPARPPGTNSRKASPAPIGPYGSLVAFAGK